MKISYAEYIKKSDVSVLVAETIFNDLLSDSPILKIKDVADTTSGGTPLRSNSDFYGGEIPWLKSGELNDGFIESAEEFITEKGLNGSSAKLHPEGTLLVAMYGATAGKTGITKFKASTNQAVCAVFPNDKVSRDYLFWFFRSHRYQYIEKSKGGAQPNISQTVINSTSIPVPDNDIQTQVVSVLDTIYSDGKIDVNKIPDRFRTSVKKVVDFKNSVSGIATELTCQLDIIKQLRQSFFREAMQGKLVEQNPNDEPASQLLEKIKTEKERLFKEKKLGKDKRLSPIKPDEIPYDIPDNWVWCRLGEIVNLITSGSRDWAKYYSNDGAVFIRMGNLSKETYKLRLEKIQHVQPPQNSEGKRTRLEENDILISITGEVGNLGLIPKDFGEAYINQHTGLVRLNPFIYPLYIANCFLSSFLKRQFDAPQRGLKNSFRLGDIDSLIIPLPPQSEQKHIVSKLDEVMKVCDELEESIKGSQQQNEMLLQQVLREALEPKKEIILNE
jgi:type I restriction enzyme S subunit